MDEDKYIQIKGRKHASRKHSYRQKFMHAHTPVTTVDLPHTEAYSSGEAN